MYESRFVPQAITVFTTNERVQLFQAALGLEPDFRCDYEKCPVLFDELFNLGAAGGQLAILDEDFFVDVGRMLAGVRSYVDDSEACAQGLALVVVCSRRKAGDPVLRELAEYCDIYDIVYDCDYAGIVNGIEKIMRRQNSRLDVLELFRRDFGEGEPEESPQVTLIAPPDTPSDKSMVLTMDNIEVIIKVHG
ncbi:MAG: hypothetical protein ACI362_02735 [Coriobacteriales bacterium]